MKLVVVHEGGRSHCLQLDCVGPKAWHESLLWAEIGRASLQSAYTHRQWLLDLPKAKALNYEGRALERFGAYL